MKIEATIKHNIAIHAHPIGCREYIRDGIEEISALPPVVDRPLEVLIIGGSSGYGLSSRIVMGCSGAYTLNVSFEKAPRGKSTGTAGFYNNFYYKQFMEQRGVESDDLNGDCFSTQMKEQVIDLLQKKGKKIDLLIYSVAAGSRTDPATGIRYNSALKPIGRSFSGYTADIASESLVEKTLEPASEEEIAHTIKVMGGEDYLLWVQALEEADLWNQEARSITYTYIGTDYTDVIYKNGTIGQAKRHLEQCNDSVNDILKRHHGKVFISSSKSVVTKASVFIPAVTLYAGALFRVMRAEGTHESIFEHKYRLFRDMVFGDNPVWDEKGFLRLDAREIRSETQEKVVAILNEVNAENFRELTDFAEFKKEFLLLNGFGHERVDYEADVDMSIYTDTETPG